MVGFWILAERETLSFNHRSSWYRYFHRKSIKIDDITFDHQKYMNVVVSIGFMGKSLTDE